MTLRRQAHIWTCLHMIIQRPFHNWHTGILQHCTIGMFQLRKSSRIRCTISRIRCICFSGHIESPQNREIAHYSEATKYDPNCRSATHKHLYERLTTFCMNNKGPKMNHSWLCVCFATLRLLLKVSYVILQCFTSIAPVVSLNLPCFATIIIILSILSISVSDHNRPWMLLIVCCIQLCPQKSVGNCRYEYPL